MSLRSWIARKLAPETFENASRYVWLKSRMHESYRWLGEFEDIAAFLEWSFDGEHNTWLKLDERPLHRWKWYGDISDFREQLRRRADKKAPTP